MSEAMEEKLAKHRFFAEMAPAQIAALAPFAAMKSFPAGTLLAKEGSSSDLFYLLVNGRAAIESYQSGQRPTIFQTLQGGEIIGWSWIFPPYEWVFDARALTDVDAIAFDAQGLRAQCEKDPVLGYELMKRFAKVMVTRLKATRLQLMDIYGRPSAKIFQERV